jgi:hypothetical protein
VSWFLSAYFVVRRASARNEDIAFHVAGFAIVVIPMDVALVHAGLAASGAAADTDYFVLLLTLVLMHGIGLYFVQTEIQESLKE